MREENEWIRVIATDASVSGFELSRSTKRDLTVSLGNARLVTVSKTSAFAAKLEALEAEVNGNIASAFSEMKTQVETVNRCVTATAQ